MCGLLVLAGCTTGQRPGNVKHVPNWERPEIVTPELVVPPQPMPSPAPSITPSNVLPSIVVPILTNRFPETWISLNRWSQSNGFGGLKRISPATTPTFALTTPNGVLVIRVGSLLASWDGLEVRLGYAPQLIDTRPFVHTLDVRKNILPLINNPAGFTKTNRVIVLDPGHGGQDAGATSVFNNHREKEFTLDWARRLEQLLATNGWQVFLTRTSDREVSLTNRVAFAEQKKADFFLSLHFNTPGGVGPEPAGLETYCLTPAGLPSTLTRDFPDDATQVFPNNEFDAQNLQFASRLHRALIETTGATDRGLRHARFMGVLRGQQRPAVLIEGGYLSNPREADLIATPAYRQKLANAVALAVREIAGGRPLASDAPAAALATGAR